MALCDYPGPGWMDSTACHDKEHHRMTNRNKAKGTAWESEIVTELQDHGHTSARRVVQAGAADVGDVHVGAILSPLVAIEAKNEKALTISTYVDEANREGDNAGALFGGVAWVKRRGKARARDGYVIMDGATFMQMLAALDTQLARGGALPQHVLEDTRGRYVTAVVAETDAWATDGDLGAAL